MVTLKIKWDIEAIVRELAKQQKKTPPEIIEEAILSYELSQKAVQENLGLQKENEALKKYIENLEKDYDKVNKQLKQCQSQVNYLTKVKSKKQEDDIVF